MLQDRDTPFRPLEKENICLQTFHIKECILNGFEEPDIVK